MSAVRRLVATEDVIEDGVAMARAGVPFRDAAAELWSRGLTPDATAYFAIRGIGAVLSDRIESWAVDDAPAESEEVDGLRSTARGRLSVLPKHYARDHWERVLSRKNWEGADGRRKALLEFTFEDATLRLTESKARAVGHMKVADAMTLVISLLSKHKAVTVAALPVKAKVAIAEAVS